MSADQQSSLSSKQGSSDTYDTARFRVLDVKPGPHGGLTLRLRFESGELPKIRKLLNATLTATAPKKQKSLMLEVEGFPVFGGKPSVDRLYRTGRIDLNVSSSDEGLAALRPGWKISAPVS